MAEIMVLLGILGLLLAIAIPSALHARNRVHRDLCIHNLARIDSAKAAWALENGLSTDTEPGPEDLVCYFADTTMPLCPAGGEYEIGYLDESPFCTLEDLGHIYMPAGESTPPAPPNGNGHGNGRPPGSGVPAPGGGPPPWAKPNGR